MISVRQGAVKRLPLLIAVAALAALWAVGSSTQATIFVVGEPPAPVTSNVFTTDPGPVGTAGTGARGITLTRRLRQTFKNPTTFDVGQVLLGFDTGAAGNGLTVSFYQVDDVNADTWAPGPKIHEFQYFGTLPGTAGRLGFSLTGSDIFSLPARFNGTTGYGLELSNIDNVSTPGQIIHSSSAAEAPDLYVDGRYFTETGAGSNNRDFAVWLLGPDPNIPAPGDVDGMNGVNLDDLTIIATHFNTNGNRANGDVTGDGRVDIFDFREWKAHYPLAGSGGVSFESLLGIPEPASGVLFLMGLAGLGYRRRLA